MTKTTETPLDAQDIVAQADTGARSPSGIPGRILWFVPLCWSIFQLWYASPFTVALNDTEARSIHLAFAIFLAFTAYPALRSSPRDRIPLQDWIFALAGSFSAAYLFLFYSDLATRAGAPTSTDIVVAVTGMVLLLEATRRALGPPLMVVAAVFLVYTFAGPHMPDVIAHKGASLNKTMSHMWLTTEGVFGVALGVSTSFVFLFVLFGALLDRAGAGGYFIKVAFSLLGHMRGGPAKAAVVASGLSGLISGSSIANVVTTGTFTIPLMKRVGFPGTKAGAVEVAASTNGQLTPPIMGAAAFLMVEYVGIPYIEVIKAAILPAIISYIALIYIVHLEACKAGMTGLPRRHTSTFLQTLQNIVVIVIGICVLSFAVYYGIGWTKDVFGAAASPIIGVLIFAAYVALVRYSSQFKKEAVEDPAATDLSEVPDPGPTVRSGLYYLLPIVVLVWCLMVERFSPGLSAFWATLFMMFIVVTQRPLMAFFRKEGEFAAAIKAGFVDLAEGFVAGARNMIGIGVATAAAGIVVGVVTLTGIGLVMTDFVEFISGGNIILMLLFTAVISLILGMGLPTTANYIVVSTLMAPVIVTLGAQEGLIIPLIAVHLFVFYFGILADDTPPVGLAAFAAAAIAKSDPIKTGIQGFTYDIRTAILPFMFIFNTQLLLMDLDGPLHLFLTIFSAVVAMLVFSAATQGWWLTKNKWYETVLMLLITFALFRPGFFWDELYAPTNDYAGTEIIKVAETLPDGQTLNIQVKGENIDGNIVTKHVHLPVDTAQAEGLARVLSTGLELRDEDGGKYIDMIQFGSPAEKAGIDFDWEVVQVSTPAERPMKEWVFVPTLLLLAGLAWNQRRRLKQTA
ncbi:C4-dicarboxylate ABC transporter [Enterovibrio norvegicus]|uniref:TRAP transporter, 4TM/12TM fusion protein n=2 Tax=Enterovibrio norvegicus TaxID=188144 RepID=A0A1I5U984_9GAMM|nr:TRAP transporter permease [Enterovibrio norvegicus]OEE50546.1 C4-dicarboxylate ABC transporter [Enterovibrio norvegicus]OEF50853.1 C4-dicarboxylate ABC transporter [Enterovibrio norvegicus]OEF59492.1 C4-dicarboxylate ABC transporter [Enterovibrio norvegicus]TKF13194.1 TRAP transporter fused permease subunit [Enterovibrio norvegicus]SFP91778.1 TRAP transporter, 4TM/12TM fusion protein [Enterovibrio norvegicus DSM 15893]